MLCAGTNSYIYLFKFSPIPSQTLYLSIQNDYKYEIVREGNTLSQIHSNSFVSFSSLLKHFNVSRGFLAPVSHSSHCGDQGRGCGGGCDHIKEEFRTKACSQSQQTIVAQVTTPSWTSQVLRSQPTCIT